jgi:hypothetical protein
MLNNQQDILECGINIAYKHERYGTVDFLEAKLFLISLIKFRF